MRNKWLILLSIAGALAMIFIIFFAEEAKRKRAPLKDVVSEEEDAGLPNSGFKQGEKIEEAKIEDAYLEDKKGIIAASSADILEKPFAIQVYSFQDKDRAELALASLSNDGYPAYIVTKDLGEKGLWHRVWVGRFQTKEEAEALLKELKKDYKDSFIVSR